MKILVGGAGSGSGKTTFIRLILKTFPKRFTVMKISVSEKYPCEKVTDKNVLNTSGKDTYYFLHGGAKQVLWIKGDRECVGRLLKKEVPQVRGDLIIEGNSAIYFVKPDISFFVFKCGEEIEKESAVYFKNRANYLVENIKETVKPYIYKNVLRISILKEFECPSAAVRDILGNLLQFT
ncbi:MAG: hypothetical protein J7L03_03920 [Caldisericaceae bacterium]|nr:hypothetical protein [Caldisericaceae bacterium]